MTHAEAVPLALSLVAWGAKGMLNARVEGDRIVFGGPGAQTGTHSLDIGSSSRDRVHAHWRGFVTSNDGEPPTTPPPARKTGAQLDREIASVLHPGLTFQEIPPRRPAKQHVRRMVVITFWGDPRLKAGGQQQLGEFTARSDRNVRAWNASGKRWNKYEIDTQNTGKAYGGFKLPDGSIDPRNPARAEPDYGVKSVRPATLKDLKRFHFTLPTEHTLEESPELEAERRQNCAYCGKPTRKGSMALDEGQTAHRSCIKEFES